MIRKWLYIILLMVMVGCKPESPVLPDDTQEEVFTLYVDNTYNVDKDIIVYMQPFSIEVLKDYAIDEGLNKVGVAYGGEITEIGVFEWDFLTFLTGIYDVDKKNPIIIIELYITEDTVNTVGMNEYTWVLDEQTKWTGGVFTIIIH